MNFLITINVYERISFDYIKQNKNLRYYVNVLNRQKRINLILTLTAVILPVF